MYLLRGKIASGVNLKELCVSKELDTYYPSEHLSDNTYNPILHLFRCCSSGKKTFPETF